MTEIARPRHSGSEISAARARAGAPGRSAEEIRRDIVAQREALGGSMEMLRRKSSELTDWRRQVREHRTELMAGAAVVGFVVGGLMALRRR